MQFKLFSAIVASSLISVASGVAIEARNKLDVFVPRIIKPDAATTWVVGRVETVTWDTSNAPVNISNGAAVQLNSVITGPLPDRLAQGFDLRSGHVDVTVPNVAPGEYTITLFGDSGNRSPKFNIVAGY